MRIIYKKPIVERVSDVIRESEAMDRAVDAIYLDKREWEEFRRAMNSLSLKAAPSFIPMSSKETTFQGIRVALDPRHHKGDGS